MMEMISKLLLLVALSSSSTTCDVNAFVGVRPSAVWTPTTTLVARTKAAATTLTTKTSTTAHLASLSNDDDNKNDSGSTSSSNNTKTRSSPKSDNEGFSFDVSELLSSIQNFDYSSLTSNLDLDKIKENFLGGGAWGERGEAYTVAQMAVIFCLLGGGIPFVGDLVMLLLGPVLMVTGLGVLVVAIGDMGESLGPWTKPVTSPSAQLVTDGLFAQMRHPCYAGLLAMCAGFSIVTGSASRLLLTSLLWYVLELQADVEEVEMAKVYPQYESYKKQVTGKFFPQEIIDAMPWMKKE